MIDNPTALIQEWDWPELYSDTDTAIYWEYKNSDGKTAVVFSSWREAGVWGQVEAQIAGNEAVGALYLLTCIGWRENHGGEIVLTHFTDDENGNTGRESVLMDEYADRISQTDSKDRRKEQMHMKVKGFILLSAVIMITIPMVTKQ